MISLNTYNHIILDCDGVVFDSNALKVIAFEHALRDEHIAEDIIKDFIENHKKTGGVSRYVKFKALFSDLLQIPFDENMYERLLSNYGNHCKSLYREVAFTEGLIRFLEKTKELDVKLHIASGSDQEELIEVFADREIKKYFINILGSPTTKNDCVATIIAGEPDKKYLMIGDAESDYKAAANNNIDFVAMTGYSEVPEKLVDIANEHSVYIIRDLSLLA